MTIISSPGFSNVVIAKKTEKRAPGETRMFSCVVFTSNVSEVFFARAERNLGKPLACPYFRNPSS